jgi:hypothetical protein
VSRSHHNVVVTRGGQYGAFAALKTARAGWGAVGPGASVVGRVLSFKQSDQWSLGRGFHLVRAMGAIICDLFIRGKIGRQVDAFRASPLMTSRMAA